MLPQDKLRFTTLAIAWMLLILSPSADAFHGNSRGLSSPSRLPATISKSSYSRSISVRTQSVEEDFRQPYGDVVDESGTLSKITSRLSNLVRFDKKRVAKLGVSFMMTYNLISNVNGSIFLSLAWYITSLRTGLSPLAPGGWKSLLAAYGSLYVFTTIFRPIRLALAVGMTKKTNNLLEHTQTKFGCSRATAVGLVLSLMLLVWLSCAAGGVALASTAAGVPIWKI
jgi:hypothetical protein